MNPTEEAPRGASPLAGICAILIGVVNVVLVVYILATPGACRYDVREFLMYFSRSPLALSLAWIVFAISAVLSYAVMPVVYDLVKDVSQDWARAATLFGIVGYTVLGVWAVTLTRTAPRLARSYVEGDETARTAIVVYGLPEIDPDGWFMFGGTGTWLIVMSGLALRGSRRPKAHAIIGVLAGVSAWLTVFGALLEFEPLNLAASAGGALFYPAWFIWLGLSLLRPSL